jgi:hypothetical protein
MCKVGGDVVKQRLRSAEETYLALDVEKVWNDAF